MTTSLFINSNKIVLSAVAALSLFSTLTLTSCSEDKSQLMPQVQKTSELSDKFSNLKEDTPGNFPTTNTGQPCKGCNPAFWSIIDGGVSTSTYLYGNSATPWLKQFLPSRGFGKFITLRSNDATTTINNLIPGKTYTIKFSVSTGSVKFPFAGQSPYAQKAYVSAKSQLPTPEGHVSKLIDLSQKPGFWVDETLTFTADNDSYLFLFSIGISPGYANIYVGEDAIKMLD